LTAPEPSTHMVLVRHGEADCNVRSVIGGHLGCTGLSPLGVAQAEALRARWEVTGEMRRASAFYASVLPRAIQTAEIIAPALGDLELRTDCNLCEMHPGECDAMTWEDFGRLYPTPDFSVEPDRPLSPGGESWSGLLRRVDTTLRALADRHAGETVVVACHGGVVNASLVSFLALAHDGTRLDLRTRNTSITEWERESGRWRLLRYNDSAHLARVAALD
jgi:2,3-bisphosphoglycerate-dependent phosphoglycerate mutase